MISFHPILLALGLTAADVSQQLRARNIDMGGGRGDVSGREYSIRALGAVDEQAVDPVGDRLRDAADPRGDDGAAGRLRLEDHGAEGLQAH